MRKFAAIRGELRRDIEMSVGLAENTAVVCVLNSGVFRLTISDSLMLCPAWEPKVRSPAYCVEDDAAFGRRRVKRSIDILGCNSFL